MPPLVGELISLTPAGRGGSEVSNRRNNVLAVEWHPAGTDQMDVVAVCEHGRHGGWQAAACVVAPEECAA
jgi:hypothetical protein